MPTPTIVAAALLAVCLIVFGLLAKAKAFGPLTSAGFALGAVATASGFVLFG